MGHSSSKEKAARAEAAAARAQAEAAEARAAAAESGRKAAEERERAARDAEATLARVQDEAKAERARVQALLDAAMLERDERMRAEAAKAAEEDAERQRKARDRGDRVSKLGLDLSPGHFNYAFCGFSGVGKSTFVNAIRGVGDEDGGAAAVSDLGQCTMKATAYPLAIYPAISMYDLPGGGTVEHPFSTYFEDKLLDLYHGVLLLYHRSLPEEGVKAVVQLIRAANANGVGTRVALVYNKMDEAMKQPAPGGKYIYDADRNKVAPPAGSDEFNVRLASHRKTLTDEIEDLFVTKMGVPHHQVPRVFFISAVRWGAGRFDFDELELMRFMVQTANPLVPPHALDALLREVRAGRMYARSGAGASTAGVGAGAGATA